LKGISGNLGMKELHQACVEAEADIGRNSLAFDEFVRRLEAQLEIVLRALRVRRKSSRKDEPATRPAPHNVNEYVTRLKALLRNQDPEAVALARELGSVRGYEKEFEELRNCMKSYDFDAAIGILETVRIDNHELKGT
ncbi:MAG TPA: hypothetical protein VG737_11480, partial [Cyclobacteriaceae bacterium]|nr:hypothetical protein [Cyclobacteriaceae bacterium]